MSSYPESSHGYPHPPSPGTIYQPPPAYPSSPKDGDNNAQELTTPQFPPRWWQWGFIAAGLGALGLQAFSLTRALDSTNQQTKFAAQVAEWEKANEERKKAFDSWSSLQTDLSDQVEKLRLEASKQKAENELLSNSRNQALRDAEFERGNLEQIKKDVKTDRDEKGLLQTATAQLKADRDALSKEKEQLLADVSALNQKIIAESAKFAAAQESTAAQEQLLETSRKRFEAMEKQLTQLDDLLSARAETVAKFQSEKEKAATLQAEQKKIQLELETTKVAKDNLSKEIEETTRQLTVLRTTMKDTQTEVDRSNDEATRLEGQVRIKQKRLTELTEEESELSRRFSSMTDSMSKIAGSAADTLQDLATKATAVQEAIKALEVKREEFKEFERLQLEAEKRRKEAEQKSKEAEQKEKDKENGPTKEEGAPPKTNDPSDNGNKGGAGL